MVSTSGHSLLGAVPLKLRQLRSLLPRFYPARARVFAAAGDASRDLKNWRDAAEQYAKALEVYGDWPGILVQYGHALKEGGNPPAAEAAYRRAIALEPENADTYLQLGHVVKIQGRRSEAIENYAAALLHNPHLLSAREELTNLGLTTSFVNLELAKLRDKSKQQVESGPRDARRSTARGEVMSVGRRQIRCLLWGVTESLFPASLTARTIRSTLAVHPLTEVPGSGPAEYVIDLPNDIAISDQLQVHVFLEPLGIELEGSPIVLVGSETSDLLRRLERLEFVASTMSTAPSGDALAEVVGLQIMGQVNALLQQQQMAFERQLLAMGANDDRRRRHQQAERHILGGDTPFPGYGWFEAERGAKGNLHRWMAQRSLLLLPVTAKTAHLLWITVDEVMSEHLLKMTCAKVSGRSVPVWITPRNAELQFTVLVEASSINSIDQVGIALEVGDALYAGPSDRRRLTFAVSRIEFFQLREALQFPIRVDGQSPYLVVDKMHHKGSTSIVLPGSTSSLEVELQVSQPIAAGTVGVMLNGLQVGGLAVDGSTLKVVLPASAVQDDANVLIIAHGFRYDILFIVVTEQEKRSQ